MANSFITFLMPVTSQPRYHKRIRAFQDCGYEYYAFSFERDYFKGRENELLYTSLGYISHQKYLARVPKLIGAIRILAKNKQKLVHSSCIYTFGLDTAILAYFIKSVFRINTPLVYEVADIRSVMQGNNLRNKIFRWIERIIIRKAALIPVTSPAFRDEYFVKWQKVLVNKFFLLENKLYPPVPRPLKKSAWDGSRPLVIGLFGVIRCQKSWELLYKLAKENLGKIVIIIKGYVLNLENFDNRINELENLVYEGEYVSPDDLAEIYSKIDICFIGNLGNESLNAKWALPNRYYESLYYNVPMIAHDGSGVGERVRKLKCGWVIDFNNVKDAINTILALTPEEVHKAILICKQNEKSAIGLEDHIRLIQQLQLQPEQSEDRL